jgi:hypothetical protein
VRVGVLKLCQSTSRQKGRPRAASVVTRPLSTA